MVLSYWTLRRRANAHVAHNIQRIYQELDAEDTLDGEVRSDLNIATRLSGTISTEGTALQNLHYTFGLESDILNEAAPPGQTSARDDDGDGGDDVDPLNGDFCHLHWYFGHLFPMQKSHDSDKSPIMGFLSLGLVLLSLGLVLLSRDKYPTWDFGHLTGVFAS